MENGYSAMIRRGELWIDEDDRFYVESEDGERTHVDSWLSEQMVSHEPRMHRSGQKFLGVGKVYVFVGTDDWEQFRDQVKEAERMLSEGDVDAGMDELRNALQLSEGLA